MALNDAVPSSATDVFKRNAEDTDKLLNASGPVTNRLGNQLLSWEQITQSHASWNNRGAWATATDYAINDIWEDGGVWYVVLSAYTSGASAATDIAGPNIAVLNGNFGSAATKYIGTDDDEIQTNEQNRAEYASYKTYYADTKTAADTVATDLADGTTVIVDRDDENGGLSSRYIVDSASLTLVNVIQSTFKDIASLKAYQFATDGGYASAVVADVSYKYKAITKGVGPYDDDLLEGTGVDWERLPVFIEGEVGKKIKVVAGALRQQSPVTITGITRSGSTATATHTEHGYSTSDRVLINGANELEYNGYYVISNVTTNTYDYTVSGSPSTPATGTITSRKPSQWNWIDDTFHAPVGLDSSSPLIATDVLTVPYDFTGSKVVSLVAVPDETFAAQFGATIGASVGTSSATLHMSMDRSISALIRYDGVSALESVFIASSQQGGSELTQVNITDISVSGSGVVTVTHDYLKGLGVSLDPATDMAGVNLPYLPILGTVSNTSFTFRVYDPATGAYITALDNKWRFNISKTHRGRYRFDSLEGDGNQSRFDLGNIWIYGLMEA